MALAILKYRGATNGEHQFIGDIGTNRFYEFRIGKSKNKSNGFSWVDEVVYTSPLLAQQPSRQREFSTEFFFTVNNDWIKDGRFIQLFSYKNNQKVSPAISEVVTIKPSLLDENNFKLPSIMFSNSSSIHTMPNEVTYAALDFREAKVSEAMFWGNLIKILPDILGKALPIITEVAGKISAENKSGNGKDSASADSFLSKVSPEMLKAIADLIAKFSENKPAEKTAVASSYGFSMSNGDAKQKSFNPETLLKLAPLLEKVLSPETIKAIGDQPLKLFQAIADSALKLNKQELDHLEKINPGVKDDSVESILKSMSVARSTYSQAKVAPALLAALPALMPLIEKVLSPDMIKAIGDQPVQLLKAISDGALQLNKQELDHLERINPGVNDPSIERILNAMSLPAYSSAGIPFTFSDKIELNFLSTQTIHVGSSEKIVYSRNGKMHLPVKLTLKKPNDQIKVIPKGLFQLIIKDAESMKVLLEKRFKVKDVPLNQPVAAIILNQEEIKRLPLNQDVKAEVSFIWKNKKGTFGTFKNHYIYLVDTYMFNKLGDKTTHHKALSDVVKHRDFWHKMWEGGMSNQNRWELNFECKYYYAINDEDKLIKRLDTHKKLVTDTSKNGSEAYRRKVSAKLKSGLEISLEALNGLLPELQLEPLSAQQLNSLRQSTFTKESNRCARVGVEFKGKAGQTVALWTYPEVVVHDLWMNKVKEVNPNGQVISVEEEKMQFPVLSDMHFIGTRSN